VSDVPEISIIVPVYNSAESLRAAVDSALAQTFGDIEVICVDDGSTDGSARILADMAAADPRIRIIPLPSNRGASAARNAGIDAARGNYVFFLDSDDHVPAMALERLLAAAKETNCELAIGKLLWLRQPEESPGLEALAETGAVMVAEFRKSTYLQTIPGCHCCNLYSRGLLNRHAIRYDTGLTFGEDQLFQATALAAAGRVAMLDEVVYVYHHYPERSVTRKTPTLANLLDDVVFHRRIAQLLSDQGLAAAGDRYLRNWSYSIREYWLQIPEALTFAQAEMFFSAFRAIVAEQRSEPWNESTPAHHRHVLALILAAKDDEANRFLASPEAREGFTARVASR
jgi:glycosyltransferase involved in cell wall biosynthesis